MIENPSHKKQLASLKRIEGQIRGIINMIDNGKYCIDVLNQIKAAKSALVSVESKVLKTHMLNHALEIHLKVKKLLIRKWMSS
jgi:DNA-binding FrmR family transcriptional regulator